MHEKKTLAGGDMKWMLCICVLQLLILSAIAQPTAKDYSYYPLHVGNIWTYRVSVITDPSPKDSIFIGYETTTITHDTILPNGMRYYVMSGTPTRIDSSTGKVLMFTGYKTGGNCPDSLEAELFNISVDSTQLYELCNLGIDWIWLVNSSAKEEKAGLLDHWRYLRYWEGFTCDRRFAEGIGLCYWATFNTSPPGRIFRDLVYARIDNVQYYPVDFRLVDAVLLPGNTVYLRWITENEMQNAGFHVERRPQRAEGVPWEDIAYIPPSAPEGQGGEYSYIDNTAADVYPGHHVEYRIRQQDFDGTTMHSPVVLVKLDTVEFTSSLTIWPNPVTSMLNIDIKAREDNPAVLIVSDMLGREVYRYKGLSGRRHLQWDLRVTDGLRATPGVYNVLLIQGGATRGRTIIVQ